MSPRCPRSLLPHAGSAPRPPWVELLRQAAQSLHPLPAQDELASNVARATCQPWSVRVGSSVIRVVYADPPRLPEEIPE
jgi:hypothetical protein